MSRSALFGTVMVMLVGASSAIAGNPPPLPSSALKAIQTKDSDATGAAKPDSGAAPAAVVEGAVVNGSAPVMPAERAAADDESAKLASEVPAEDVAIPAAEWLTQDVGGVATRPVNPDANLLEPVVEGDGSNETIQDEAASSAVSTPVVSAPAVSMPAISIPASKTTESLATNESGDEVEAKDPVRIVETVPVVTGVANSGAANTGAAELGAAKATPEPLVDETAAVGADDVAKEVAAAQAGIPMVSGAEGGQSPVVRVEAPKIVTIEADYRAPEAQGEDVLTMKGPAAIEASRGDAPVADDAKFALVWIDGSQRSGDTFVKFYKPVRPFFESGAACLTWARETAAEGRAISPEGVQPGRQALSAGCLARDGSREYWIWRQASGAFTKSVLSPAQFALFEEVVRQWSASSKLAYGEFPVPPYAGQ